MLTSHHHRAYQSFMQALRSLASCLEQSEVSKESLQEEFSLVQQVFDQEVMTLNASELEHQTASRWQSIQTEIHRTMRLLQTDRMRWQVAKSGKTTQQRQQEVRDRVHQLIQFCHTLLAL